MVEPEYEVTLRYQGWRLARFKGQNRRVKDIMKNTLLVSTAAALLHRWRCSNYHVSMPAANAVDVATWDALAQCSPVATDPQHRYAASTAVCSSQQSWNGVGMSGSPATATRAQQIGSWRASAFIQELGRIAHAPAKSLASTARPAQLPPPSPPPLAADHADPADLHRSAAQAAPAACSSGCTRSS